MLQYRYMVPLEAAVAVNNGNFTNNYLINFVGLLDSFIIMTATCF